MSSPLPPHPLDIGEDPEAARVAAAAQVMAAAAELAEGFRTVIPKVVELQVRTVLRAWGRLEPEQRRQAERAASEAGRRAGQELAEEWEREAARPLDRQRRGPLEILRSLRRYPSAVLAEAGVPPVRRDAFSAERFPDDVYGLIVERFLDLPGDLGAELQTHHLVWGVGKAMWVKAEQAVRARPQRRPGAHLRAPDSVKIVALVDDLMDRSRLDAALRGVSYTRAVDGASGADVVVVDLARHAGAVAALRRALPAARLVCFGPHVDQSAIAAARADGADAVMPRSRFFLDPAAAVASPPRR